MKSNKEKVCFFVKRYKLWSKSGIKTSFRNGLKFKSILNKLSKASLKIINPLFDLIFVTCLNHSWS